MKNDHCMQAPSVFSIVFLWRENRISLSSSDPTTPYFTLNPAAFPRSEFQSLCTTLHDYEPYDCDDSDDRRSSPSLLFYVVIAVIASSWFSISLFHSVVRRI
jgi:hypothetical protein